jgi:hypothetical protein
MSILYASIFKEEAPTQYTSFHVIVELPDDGRNRRPKHHSKQIKDRRYHDLYLL